MKQRIQGFLSSFSVQEKGSDFFRATAKTSRGSRVFEGHFPGNPVLPGAFHVWVAYLLTTEVFGMNLALAAIEKGKFRKLLAPEDTITVHAKLLAHDELRAVVKCRIEKDGKEASRFIMTLKRRSASA